MNITDQESWTIMTRLIKAMAEVFEKLAKDLAEIPLHLKKHEDTKD